MKLEDRVHDSVSNQNKKIVPNDLIEDVKDAMSDLGNFAKKWAAVLEKGKRYGFSEQDMQLMGEPFLKDKLSRQQVYYLFHQDKKKEASKQQYQKLRNIPQIAAKKEPEQSDIDEGAEAEKAYLAEKAYEASASAFIKKEPIVPPFNTEPVTETLNQIRARAIPPPPEADSNDLNVVIVGRYGLFDTKKTAEVLTRDLGRLKSSGWKIAEITARHIS